MTGNLFSDGNMPTTPGENENMQVISVAASCPLKGGYMRLTNNGFVKPQLTIFGSYRK